MKIKLSKSQWEMVGKKAGWMKTSQSNIMDSERVQLTKKLENFADDPNVRGFLVRIRDSKFYRKPPMGKPADEPTTEQMKKMLKNVMDSDPSINMRPIKVTFNNGDVIETNVNGTKREVLKYYLPYGNRGDATDYDINKPNATRYPIKVEFLED